MDAAAIDQIRLNFSPQALVGLNVVIGLMMLGVSLDLKIADFKRVIVSPKAPAIGLGAQFILLPAFTFLLTLIIRPAPSIALGMIRRKPLQYHDLPGQGKCSHFRQHDRRVYCGRRLYDAI